MNLRQGPLANKIRFWPLLSADSKTVLIEIVLKGTPIRLNVSSESAGDGKKRVSPEISALVKSGCLAVLPARSMNGETILDVTPSGWVQALCADARVWTNFKKVLLHLKEKMPNLALNWSTLSHSSKKVCLNLLADAIRFSVNNREWFTGNSWEAFERNFVLATFKSLEITEIDRERLLMAVRGDSPSRDYFINMIRQLLERSDISTEEFKGMMQTLRA